MSGQHKTETIEETDQDVEILDEEVTPWQLIVWNDDVNTFDWVIKSLVDICHHTAEQAEQSALLIHFKGKCSVKKGLYDKLRPKCNALLDRGITATVEAIVNA